MGTSRNLAGTIVQRGGLEKATLVPKCRRSGRTLFRDGHSIFSLDVRYRALASRISAA
jgi:hypothetical protein